ncbi:MAG: ROK family protein [Rikenellaceae bacterium]|nr:ROK family protein [Rikenellaceae bacterium]
MENALSFGVDIGGSRTKVALVTRRGELVAKEIISMADCNRVENYPKFVASLCECILRIHNQTGYAEVAGIGIGAPNANGLTGEIVNPVNLWRGTDDRLRVFNIVEDIRNHLLASSLYGVGIRITNDVNAAALGEMHFGAAQGMSNFVVIAIGTGLGGGIVLNGRLIEGSRGCAGEFGHLNAVEHGRLCGCGLRGCLEAYVSAGGIRNTYGELSKQNNVQLSAEDIFKAASLGDTNAIVAFESAGKMLGRKLADVVEMLDPEAIFLTGGVAKAGNMLLIPAQNALRESLPQQYDVELKLSELNDDFAAARGAAAMYLNKY